MNKESEKDFKLISFNCLLTLLFIVFKVTGIITWSWWWVFSPLWINLALILVTLLILLLAVILDTILKGTKND